MEEHRLKEMPKGYDQKLFNQLYRELKPLKKKLTYNIDARKFGVDAEEIQSWFDIKFIHAFCKYHSDPRVKGYIINSLQMFKRKIISHSYHPKQELFTMSSSWDDLGEAFHEGLPDSSPEPKPELDIAMEYLKQKLSPNAFFILELELTPPTFFLDRKFNPENILIYLDIAPTMENISFIVSLKTEIRQAIKAAKNHFSTSTLTQS